jgi:hypothetical protein
VRSRAVANASALTAAFALTAAIASTAGCSGRERNPASEPSRGPSGPGTGRASALEPEEALPLDRERARALEEARTPHAWGVPPSEQITTAAETTPGTDAPRDYPGELQAALGVPTECIDTESARAAAGRTLRIPVRVVMTESARVTRAEVAGPLPEAGRECVRRRAESVSLRAPIENAPRTISTEIVIAVTAQPPAEPPAAPAWRAPAGAQAPGVTLPALAPAGPAPGAVPPGHTLPAGGTGGRPEGFVPPSSTLPAIAQ